MIKTALYGGKSAGYDYWKYMRICMNHFGFESCKADPVVWMRPAGKLVGVDHCEYVLLYVDDAICCSCNPKDVLEKVIGRVWTIKKGSIYPSNI